MMHASHSTTPSMVRFAPVPAFVVASSSRHAIAIRTASSAFAPFRSAAEARSHAAVRLALYFLRRLGEKNP